MKIEDIISEYRKREPDSWIEFTKKQSSIEEAILVASKSMNASGLKNKHQHRIPNETLSDFGVMLCTISQIVHQVNSFDELNNLIKTNRIKGIGDLACYDIANRIGTFLNKEPTYVYIHAGTRTGAENLLKRKVRESILPITEFPYFNGFSASQIENILCIYKKDFI